MTGQIQQDLPGCFFRCWKRKEKTDWEVNKGKERKNEDTIANMKIYHSILFPYNKIIK